ncbi:hypothetical protein like AT3G24255 [Hibiscus trionum]|uniref:Reverse transcriptase n=1 Tax=Hibiscus trionum TaxID=183268 RepID=A0A9W7IHW5_HIBTR|nr:hypothetical protein like AT3G24255 [Hibiscus trionum]
MERLGHAIRKVVTSDDWFPFQMARHGVPLSHMFFGGDLILYAKATATQAGLISSILTEFEYFFGHKISARKTQVYFLLNTDPELRHAISVSLSYQETMDLGTYLGIPVLHHRMRCVDFDFLISKMRSKLNGWADMSLSLAGRITLAKSVLSSIPIYFMQTTRLPSGICSEINKLVCGFVWGLVIVAGSCP